MALPMHSCASTPSLVEHGPSTANRIAPVYKADWIVFGHRSVKHQHTLTGVERDHSHMSHRLSLTREVTLKLLLRTGTPHRGRVVLFAIDP